MTVASNMAMAAEDRRVLAEIPASGIIFKDIITLEAFPDPKVNTAALKAQINKGGAMSFFGA